MSRNVTPWVSPYVVLDRNNLSYASPLVCYAPTMISVGGIWQEENPLNFSFPLFLLQLLLIVLVTRATAIIIRPLKQPRYVAEVIGGLLLGPSVMGRMGDFADLVFPFRSILILETMAYLGLIYFIFIIGIEIDLNAVRRTTQSMSFAAVCVMVPFFIGAISVLIVHPKIENEKQYTAFLIFLCVTLSITAFTVLARTLAELKLLNTGLGSTALSSAMLVDGCAWILLTISITLVHSETNTFATVETMASGLAFYVVTLAVVKPAVMWVTRQTPEGEEVDDLYACVILVMVLVMAFIADAIGIHAITGAFLFGLMVPNGPLGEALMERVEDFVEGLLLPLFFATSGLKTNFKRDLDTGMAWFLVFMVTSCTVAKIAGCVLVAHLFEMPPIEGLSIGLLMNTKGIMELVLLNIGRDRMLLSEDAFSILVIMSVLVTVITSPLLALLVRPARCITSYQRRTIAWHNSESELRMVVCVHTNRHVPTMIALLDATNPCKRSPILVFALHLIELTDRASAMLAVHTTTSKDSQAANSSRGGSDSSRVTDPFMHAFETYEQHAAGMTVYPFTAVSPYPSMHQDICSAAENNHAAFIVLPFHKHQTIDGAMEVTNPAIRTLNLNILNAAPCSVAILVDRGLRTTARYSMGNTVAHNVVVLFIGGPDDREALALANRMAEHPSINLAVLRFIIAASSPRAVVTVSESDEERERKMDEDCISDFRLRNAGNESIVYVEKVASNSEETVAEIRATVDQAQDLYIVGRGSNFESPLTAGLTDWSECPELGGIGDLLASSDIATVSVLVVQQGKAARGLMFKDMDGKVAAKARESDMRRVRPLDID